MMRQSMLTLLAMLTLLVLGLAARMVEAGPLNASGVKPRVIVSTDLGGSDEDDRQSMVHYMVYSDRFDTEGLISSPPYGGRKSDILEMIDIYETDYGNLNSHADFPTPQSLRDVTKQGAIGASPSAGYGSATEGSNWIISQAHVDDSRPLYVLAWGSITDVAQAVHDDPSIKDKIRVYSIGSWNTVQDPNARNYLYNNHSDLWWIEDDTTFRGMYIGGDQSGDLGNRTFVEQHVRHHGALGDFYYARKPEIKMGDTPSVLYLLNGDPDAPTTEHWGGMFGATGHGPEFWTDLTDPQYREGSYDGAKTVNMHRVDYLRDWQTRMDWAKEAAPEPLPGDFNDDGKVDGADLTDPTGWEARFGVDLDGSDFLIWQRNITGSDGGLGAGTVVPEPSTALLLGALLCMATTIRSKRWFVYLAIGTGWLGDPAAGIAQPRDLYSDTWVATDSLGRTLPGYSEVGPPRENKTVGLFYFLWHGEHGTGGPYDVTELLAANPTNPAWGPEGDFHHWGQSELGYYLSDDEYVMRKHAHMLADAGVDVIIFDITNGFTYKDNYMALSSVFMDIRANGGTTPQIAFMANAYADNAVKSIYNDLYGPGLYSDLWFDWKGKPLVLAPLDGMVVNGRTINHSQQVLDFFSMRYSWTWMDIEDPDVWKWMDYYPQQYGWHESSSIPEQISVSAGMVPHGSGVGRSYQNGSQPPDDEYDLTGTEDQGYFFAEQWSRFDTIDPEFLFITGWNEWVAQRQVFTGSGDPVTHFTGDPLEAGDTWFIDAYNQEYSRDIEPMKGGHTDNYYYQMIDGIRRYKGVRQPQSSSPPKTIAIDGSFLEWNRVGPEYRDTAGDTAHRDHDGWGSLHYTNTTGRNDFLTGKVTSDAEDVYFYVETQESITPHTDQNWMMLFIDADLDSDTGWNGYDFVANRSVVDSDTTTLMSTSDGQTWTLVDSLDYAVSGNMLELRIPRTVIGQDASAVSLNFHWADNMQTLDDIAEFFINGDSAPNRRFDYHYESLPLLGDFGTVNRTNGQSGDRPPIGAFDGETNPLSSPVDGIQLGMTAYSDREYTFDSVDQPLVGAAWVRTFNTDKSSGENGVHYQVTLLEDAFMMVLMDDRYGVDQQTMVDQVVEGFAAPGQFTDTDWDISLDEPEEYDFSAFGALLSAGTYNFGPSPNASLSFYMIAARTLVDGDFNMDFDVDDADLAIWQAGFGIQSSATRGEGDADGDGDVDGGDFLIWQSNFGASGSGASAGSAVPEPASAPILLMAAALVHLAFVRRVARARPGPAPTITFPGC